MKIYLAGRYEQKRELARKADDLGALGHTITSSWLGEPDSFDDLTETNDASLRSAANQDLEDIDNSDILVLFTVPPNVPFVRGARHVEFGYAIGKGITVCIVGEKENIFSHLLSDDLVFDTWEQFLEAAASEELL